jgi:glycine cleavage system aminomethyltransferase T
MLKDLDGDRRFVGRTALQQRRSEGSARWNTVGISVDPIAHADAFERAGLLPPKNHVPVHQESMTYDETGDRVGFVTSSMYSPVLQRHIAIARIRPDLAKPGTPVQLEFTIDHRYELIGAEVTRLPMFNPERRTG